MKKRFTSMLLALLLIVSLAALVSLPVEAKDDAGGSCGENAVWSFNEVTGKLSITGTGEMDLSDQRWNQAPWKHEDLEDFRSKIKTIIVGEGITNIADRAFSYCDAVTSVSLPKTLTEIGAQAFFDCISLTSVTIPDGVKVIGEDAFSMCAMEKIAIPGGVKVIGEDAFSCCLSLKKVTISNGVNTIGDSAFAACRNLTSVTIPDSVKTIGEDAFAICPKLKSVTIPSSVDTIGNHAFGYMVFGDEDFSEIYEKIPGFAIRGYAKTAAERYASGNGLKFIYLDTVSELTISGAPASMTVGKTVTLKTTVTPSGVKPTFSSSDPKVATVNAQTGVVTAKGSGTVTITATAGVNNKKATVKIKVLRYVSMRIGKTAAIYNGAKTTIDSTGAKPFKINGRTMIPVRFVGEKMGASVKYVSDKKPIVITHGGKKVELTLGSKTMKVIENGKTRTIKIDVAAQKRNGRTYIPIRAVSESLGFDVYYEKSGSAEYVIVNNPKMSATVKKERLAEAKKVLK